MTHVANILYCLFDMIKNDHRISISQTSSLFSPAKVFFVHENFISDEFFQKIGPHHNYVDFLLL